MTDRVSTIIRCADLPHRVYESVRSIEQQAGGPGQIVLVTDETTPASARDWLTRFGAARGLTVTHAPARLPGAVRNAGVRVSRGAYVACLDAGDRLAPEFHAVCVSPFDEANIGLVTTAVLTLGPGDERHISPPSTASLDGLIGNTSLAHSSSMFRRECWDRLGGFDETLAALEDYDFFLRLIASECRGVLIHQPLLIRPWRTDALYHRSWGTDDYLDSFRRIIESQDTLFQADLVDALYTSESLLHQAGSRYRARLARHNDAKGELERLATSIEELRASLSPHDQDRIDLGDMRRVSPIARNWGYERGTPIDRHYIENFVETHAADIRGAVLEVQESDYTTRYGGQRVSRSDVVDLNTANPHATVVADLRAATNIPSKAYDCVILTQTLHVIDDMSAVVSECARILKPGGVLLATLPCVSRVCLEYGHGGDHWRVTGDGARQLFGEHFPIATLEVAVRGNTLVNTAFMYGLACHEIAPEEFAVDDPYNPLIVTVCARKPDTGTPSPGTRTSHEDERDDDAPATSILLYHGVGERDSDPHGLWVTPEAFQAQLAHLRNHYQLISLSELTEAVHAGVVPPRAVVLTFDDGYLDNYTVASELLTAFDVPATFFVTTDQLEQTGDYEFWWDALAGLLLGQGDYQPTLDLDFPTEKKTLATGTATERTAAHWELYQMLSRSPVDVRDAVISSLRRWGGQMERNDPTRRRMNRTEMAELAARPGHAIGAHTVRHEMLPQLTEEEQRDEIALSRLTLEQILGTSIDTFAYPFGAYDQTTVRIIDGLGFRSAVTCDADVVRSGEDVLRLPRLEVRPSLGPRFPEWLERSVSRGLQA